MVVDGLVHPPPLCAGHLEHKDVMDVVVRIEPAIRGRGDVGVDLDGVAERVGEVKKREGTPFFRPDRVAQLIEKIQLQAELLELQANPDRPAEASVIEAKLDKGRGPVATVLVTRGTLKVGDVFVVGAESGKVRALAVTSPKRNPALPEVPTMAEAGVPVCLMHWRTLQEGAFGSAAGSADHGGDGRRGRRPRTRPRGRMSTTSSRDARDVPILGEPARSAERAVPGQEGKGEIVLVHLYPREMSIYGDLGNTRCLAQRIRRHGYVPGVPASLFPTDELLELVLAAFRGGHRTATVSAAVPAAGLRPVRSEGYRAFS